MLGAKGGPTLDARDPRALWLQAPGHFLPGALAPGGGERGGRTDNCDLLSADGWERAV